MRRASQWIQSFSSAFDLPFIKSNLIGFDELKAFFALRRRVPGYGPHELLERDTLAGRSLFQSLLKTLHTGGITFDLESFDGLAYADA